MSEYPSGGPAMTVSHGPAPVLSNQQIARGTFLIRLQAPALAQAIRPGQFLMLRLPPGSDPLLGRPFAL